MEQNEMNLGSPNISPRANSLAIRNHIDISTIIPTGPEGRIIENDVLRAIEERNAKAAEAKKEEQAVLVGSESEETQEEPASEMTAPAEENTAAKVPVEQTAEETEEAADPEIEVEIYEEEATEEVTKSESGACEEVKAAEEEISEETGNEEKGQETAMVAAPVIAVAKEETPASEEKTQPEEKTFRSEEMYRHTDVIIPQTENSSALAPITLEMSFDATCLVNLRAKIKEHGEWMNLPPVTINDMILFAVTKTLKKHKAMNAHFLGDKMRYFDGIHLGFTVDTERGPQTLTVFDADRLSLSSLSKITGALIKGIRAGLETPEKNLRKGSFTVTNVGTLGVERFIPVLTGPETGALSVSALTKKIKTVNGTDTIYPAIPLALTFDPRAMSTANATKFLRDLCAVLENFGLLLIK